MAEHGCMPRSRDLIDVICIDTVGTNMQKVAISDWEPTKIVPCVSDLCDS